MTAKKFMIRKVSRFPARDAFDEVEFKAGVNVIVGEMNAGKTKWLQMIDFALGDAGKPEEAFDSEIAAKYEGIVLTAEIDGEDFRIERNWNQQGTRTKIFVDGEGLTPKPFSEDILRRLDIPQIHIPSGNPYGDRAWPELSWRELFRHMYKQERFWSDFAQKQSDSVRSACVLHFMGAAGNLYPEELGALISKKKQRDKLEAQKEVFVKVMQDMAVDLLGQREMSVAVTSESVSDSREKMKSRLKDIEQEKERLLQEFDKSESKPSPALENSRHRLTALHDNLGKSTSELHESVKRKSELEEYAHTLRAELSRFARAREGSSALADLKVTHCPACDQGIPERSENENLCKVCGQVHATRQTDIVQGGRRLIFEENQVSEELAEIETLIIDLEKSAGSIEIQLSKIRQEINVETRLVNSAKAFSIRALPPEIALLDQEAGQLLEKLQQLDRVERALGSRDEMNKSLAEMEEEILELDMIVRQKTPLVDYASLGDLIADRMNRYLNKVNADQLSRWKTGRVAVKLSSSSIELFLEGSPWTVRAGGTANYIIQIAYHYALLSLTNEKNCNYPGFLIIDFPPQLSKADDLKDSENYLLKPFVELCAQAGMEGSQVIIAGRAFDNLEGANLIGL